MPRCRHSVCMFYTTCVLSLLVVIPRLVNVLSNQRSNINRHQEHGGELLPEVKAVDSFCSNGERIERLLQVCATRNLRHTTTAAAATTTTTQNTTDKHTQQTLYDFILVDDVHKILYCSIPKAASTTWKTILATATRHPAASSMSEHQVEDEHFMHSIGLRFLSTYSIEEIRTRLNGYFKFLAVRHPLARLVSAYRDKVARFNPYGIKIRENIARAAELNSVSENVSTSDRFQRILFTDFIRFLAREDIMMKFDHHWATYDQLCHVCDIQYDVIVKVETMDTDAQQILPLLDLKADDWKDSQLPRQNRHDRRGSMEKATDLPLSEFGNISSTDMNRILNIYANDMQMFGYKWLAESLTASCEMNSGANYSKCC